MSLSSPRIIVRNGLISLAALSFSAGTFSIFATDQFARGSAVAWISVGCAVVNIVAAFVVGRQTMRKIADGSAVDAHS